MRVSATLVKGAFTASALVAYKTNTRPLMYPMKEATVNAVTNLKLTLPPKIAHWDVNLTENPIDRNEKPSDEWTSALNATSTIGRILAESFIQSQQDKEARIEPISPLAGILLREAKSKAEDLYELSSTEKWP